MGQLGSGPGLPGWVIFMTPINMPLPPLGQNSGPPTQEPTSLAWDPMSKKGFSGPQAPPSPSKGHGSEEPSMDQTL